MQFLSFAVILGVFAVVAKGSPVSTKLWDSNHPGKCVYKNQVLSPGESAKPDGECGIINCISENRASMGFCTIKDSRIPAKCRLGDYVDSGSPYPNCCERNLICQ